MKISGISRGIVTAASILVVTACGGGGGGGNGTDSPSMPPTGVNAEFTEDTSLNEDIEGIWIITAEVSYTEDSSGITKSFTGTKRESIFLIEDEASPVGNPAITECHRRPPAISQLTVDDNSIQINHHDKTYNLTKISNTRFEGTVDYVSDYEASRSGGGTATMIKVKRGPSTVFANLNAFAVGALTYTTSYIDGEQSAQITCFADTKGTETISFSGDSDTESSQVESLRLLDLNFDEISVTQSSGDQDVDTLDLVLNNSPAYWSSDNEPDYVTFSTTGTNSIHVTIDAKSYFDYGPDPDSSSDSFDFSGEADLEF